MIKLFDKKVVQELKNTLCELEARPDAGKMRTRDVVEMIRDEGRQAMARGYTLEEILEIAKRAGLDISLTTLKGYLRTDKKKKGNTRTKGQSPINTAPITKDKNVEKQNIVRREPVKSGTRPHAGFDESYVCFR